MLLESKVCAFGCCTKRHCSKADRMVYIFLPLPKFFRCLAFPHMFCQRIIVKEESISVLKISPIPEVNIELMRKLFVKWERQRQEIFELWNKRMDKCICSKHKIKELYYIWEEGRNFSYLDVPEVVISWRWWRVSIKTLWTVEPF